MADKEEVILEDGTIAYKYQDGSLRNAKGHWLVAPPYKAPTITKENAAELANRRWAMVEEASASGAIRATKSDYEAEAIERITHAQARLSQDTDKGHASTKAAEFVFRAAGWLRPREQGPTVQINQVVLPPGIEKLMRERLRDADP